jgi:hypothetical protein
MKPKYCCSCMHSKITGSCMVYFCELLKRTVLAYSVDKDCPLPDSVEEATNKNRTP